MIEFLINQAPYAHWYAFGLLLLAGLNLPVSEDLIMIGSGVLAATVIPENFYLLLFFSYLGAYLSDIENYWLARLLGPRLLQFRFFSKLISPARLAQVKRYLDKYGPVTLLGGRFIPFGVRNAMFMTCGLSKMLFRKFALLDFLASVMTTAFLFGLGYNFGKNYKALLEELSKWKVYIFAAFVCLVAGIFLISKLKKEKNNRIIA